MAFLTSFKIDQPVYVEGKFVQGYPWLIKADSQSQLSQSKLKERQLVIRIDNLELVNP